MDGTIAHFDREYDRHLEERYAHLTGIPRSADQISFNLWEGRSEEEQRAIQEIMDHEGFYRKLEPMDGAIDAVKEAAALGHEVHFVSTPWASNPTCAQDKYDWIAEHFGDDWRSKLILTYDKTVVSGDILFDDKDPISRRERADWVQVFYTQPYNKNAAGYRINSWDRDEWVSIIELIAEEKRVTAARNEELAWLGSAPW